MFFFYIPHNAFYKIRIDVKIKVENNNAIINKNKNHN